MKITDAMVTAAREKAEAIALERFRYSGDPGSFHHDVQVLAEGVLEAALSAGVADQEPDVEFMAALDEYRRAAMKLQHIQTVTYRRNPSEHDVEQLDDASVRIDTARARVLALHAQARMEGVRELRAWLVNKAAPTYQNVKFDAGYFAMRDAMVDQIDAMLKGGDR